MYYLLEWLNGLLRLENMGIILGSLRRRIFGQDFLEMRLILKDEKLSPSIWDGLKIRGYSEDFEGKCISVLNSVGSLGLWNPSRFREKILSTVENPKKDVFIVYSTDAIIGFTVVHKKSLDNDLREIGWVAVRPENWGEKLGYKLLMYIMSEMKRRNIYHVYLRTDSSRMFAIKTYLRVGFHPHIRNDIDRKRWHKIMSGLKEYTIESIDDTACRKPSKIILDNDH